MAETINPVGNVNLFPPARRTEAMVVPKLYPSSDEFARFSSLAQQLLRAPKAELDEKRRGS